MSVIGLDVGTTGCKCLISDSEGNAKAFSYKEYFTKNPAPGMFELDPNEVWDAVKYVISSAVKKYKGDKINAICISSFGEAAVPMGFNGEVLYNSFLYIDSRGEEQAESLVADLGHETIMKATGLNPHPMYTICKIMWIKENMPEIFKKVWKFMLFGDFILYRLGKIAAIDYSLASRTMAFNVNTKMWEEAILNAAGIDKSLLSETIQTGTLVGTIDRRVAFELGLSEDVLLVSGGHDQLCAAIGAGITKEGIAIDGIGSVECITVPLKRNSVIDHILSYNYPCVPYTIDDMYLTYAFNFTGGSLLKWYRDNFGAKEKQEAEKEGINFYSYMDRQAEKSSSDILVLPHFAGSGSPLFDQRSKGTIVGLTFDTTSGQIYRALLEGVTYEMYLNIECLAKSGVIINQLRAVGGGSRSDIWLQIKADIMNIPIHTLNIDEAGIMGTIILALAATGKYPSIEEAARKLVKQKKEFFPDSKAHRVYLEKYSKYKKLYGLAKEIIC